MKVTDKVGVQHMSPVWTSLSWAYRFRCGYLWGLAPGRWICGALKAWCVVAWQSCARGRNAHSRGAW